MSLPASDDGRLSEADRQTLLDVARRSIRHGLACAQALEVCPPDFAPPLRCPRASFVTLEMDGTLRGCIGSLAAAEPLVCNVAHNAFSAAFQDPRFPPVTSDEATLLDVHISILSPPQPMSVESQEDLLGQLRPGVDGLILSEGARRGTFLPAVWEDLPDPRHFLAHLKLKAGLPVDYWSKTLRFQRYTCETVP